MRNNQLVVTQSESVQIQYSVYSRISKGSEGVDNHVNRLKKQIPVRGSVRVLVVTDKQYCNMDHLVGGPYATEKKIGPDQLTFF